MPPPSTGKTLLLIGASRGLGFALAEEYLGESVPNLANTMDAQTGKKGLQYLDYLGRKVPW